jgi:hypothetical protein
VGFTVLQLGTTRHPYKVPPCPLSIALAFKDYRDIGVVALARVNGRIEARAHWRLKGRPDCPASRSLATMPNETVTPQQNAARLAVKRAIQSGNLKVPYKCSECGVKKEYGRKGLEFAHTSYQRKADGKWKLHGKFKCRVCHRRADVKHGKPRPGAGKQWSRNYHVLCLSCRCSLVTSRFRVSAEKKGVGK